MLTRNLAAALLLLCAGLCNGVMDSLQFHFSATLFADATRFDPQFWNPAVSWQNKYLKGDVKLGEAYPGSSTVFVFLTDGWHLVKFLMLKFFVLAAVVALPFSRRMGFETGQCWAWNAVLFVLLHMAFQVGFKLAYV